MPQREAARQWQLFLLLLGFYLTRGQCTASRRTLDWLMRFDFRTGLFVGLVAAFAIGLYCVWLWQEERQILRHTENLFQRVEQKNWAGVADLIADDYADQWGNDRALVLERIRLVLGYGRHFRFRISDTDCKIDNSDGFWRGRITIESGDAELMPVIKEHINSLTTPFELRWYHASGKPWDWKLVRVSNAELEMPAGFD